MRNFSAISYRIRGESWDWGAHSNRDLPREAPSPVPAHLSSKGECRKWRGSSYFFQSSGSKPLVFGNGVRSDLYFPQTCVALNLRNSVGFLLDKFMENGNVLWNLALCLLCAHPALPLAGLVSSTENCLIIHVCCVLRYLVVHLPWGVCGKQGSVQQKDKHLLKKFRGRGQGDFTVPLGTQVITFVS